jgi:hypothetical protein
MKLAGFDDFRKASPGKSRIGRRELKDAGERKSQDADIAWPGRRAGKRGARAEYVYQYRKALDQF